MTFAKPFTGPSTVTADVPSTVTADVAAAITEEAIVSFLLEASVNGKHLGRASQTKKWQTLDPVERKFEKQLGAVFAVQGALGVYVVTRNLIKSLQEAGGAEELRDELIREGVTQDASGLISDLVEQIGGQHAKEWVKTFLLNEGVSQKIIDQVLELISKAATEAQVTELLSGEETQRFLEAAEAMWEETQEKILDAFKDQVKEMVHESLEKGVQRSFGTIPSEGPLPVISFNLSNPRAISYLAQRSFQAVNGINETTREDLRGLFASARAAGWSYDKLAAALLQKHASWATPQPQQHIRSRAHLIAVNELAHAYETGNRQYVDLLDAHGLAMEKRWLSVSDGRVDPICRSHTERGWIPLKEDYGGGIQHPPAHPACRCTIEYRRAKNQCGCPPIPGSALSEALVAPSAAAKQFGVPQQKLYSLAKSGKFTFTRVNGKNMADTDLLGKALGKQPVPTGPQPEKRVQGFMEQIARVPCAAKQTSALHQTDEEGAKWGRENWDIGRADLMDPDSPERQGLLAWNAFTNELGFRRFNTYLRTGKLPKSGSLGYGPWYAKDEATLKSNIAALDRLMSSFKVPANVVVQRGVSFSAVGGNISKALGKVFQDPGYMPTSLGSKPPLRWQSFDVQLHLTVPEGTHALYSGNISRHPIERELLLERGLKYVVTKITPRQLHYFDPDSESYKDKTVYDVDATVVP